MALRSAGGGTAPLSSPSCSASPALPSTGQWSGNGFARTWVLGTPMVEACMRCPAGHTPAGQQRTTGVGVAFGTIDVRRMGTDGDSDTRPVIRSACGTVPGHGRRECRGCGWRR